MRGLERGGPEYPVEPFLAYLREQVYTADTAWRELVGEREPQAADVRLFVPTDRATTVALSLYDLDRETRRAVRLITSEFRPKGREAAFARSQ
jgi:hypothetical protein